MNFSSLMHYVAFAPASSQSLAPGLAEGLITLNLATTQAAETWPCHRGRHALPGKVR